MFPLSVSLCEFHRNRIAETAANFGGKVLSALNDFIPDLFIQIIQVAVTAVSYTHLFFLFAPIAGSQSELLARTSPTIYDVFIALFGGLAGVVALSTKEKGNVIPGVAIATALMPPLCTCLLYTSRCV